MVPVGHVQTFTICGSFDNIFQPFHSYLCTQDHSILGLRKFRTSLIPIKVDGEADVLKGLKWLELCERAVAI